MNRRSRNRQTKSRLSCVRKANHYLRERTDQSGFVVEFINKEIGFGILSTKTWEEGEFLLEYRGELISAIEGQKREKEYAKDCALGNFVYYFRTTSSHRGSCIDATYSEGKGRMVNDAPSSEPSCNASVRVVWLDAEPRLCLFAKRKILPNEELRYDYGVCGLPWRKAQNTRKLSTDIPNNKDKAAKSNTASESKTGMAALRVPQTVPDIDRAAVLGFDTRDTSRHKSRSSAPMSFKEASALIGHEHTCLELVRSQHHVTLPPRYLQKQKSYIKEQLNKLLLVYSEELDGIPVAHGNLFRLQDYSHIRADDPHLRFDVQVDYIVFRPKPSNVLKAVVSKIDHNRVDGLIHHAIRVSVPKIIVYRDGHQGTALFVGGEFLLKVEKIELHHGVLSIKGIIEDET